MKKTTLFLFGVISSLSVFSQEGSFFKGSEQMNYEEAYQTPKKLNASVDTRSTTIERWVSFTDAYSAFMGSTPAFYRITNGAFTNDTNVKMDLDGDIDTAFLFSSYSIIDLDGTFYKSTWFNPALEPFDSTADITLDSIVTRFLYEKYDTSVVDTLVVRIALSDTDQFVSRSSRWINIELHPVTLDTVRWVRTEYDPIAKEIKGKVAEFKLPLDDAFINNPANWVNGDSTSFYVEFDANETLTNHEGLIGVEVTALFGRQFNDSTDTIGVNANWFSPIFYAVDGNTVPAYSPGDKTVGGTLLRFGAYPGSQEIFYNHWTANNSVRFPTSGLSVTQSPYYELKIQQDNALTASVEELNLGGALYQNYPNPSTGETVITFDLLKEATAGIEITDLTGKVVYASTNTLLPSGRFQQVVNTADFKAGIYFYTLTINGNKLTKKMVVNN